MGLAFGCQPQAPTTPPESGDSAGTPSETAGPGEPATDDGAVKDTSADADAGPSDEATTDVPSEEAVVDDVTMTLTEDCDLTVVHGEERHSHRFVFPAKCHFARTGEDAIRVVSTDSGKAVLVASSLPDGDDCQTSLQVVVVAPEGPRLSKQIQHVAMCAPQQWDEMMFHVMAAKRVTLGTPEAAM